MGRAPRDRPRAPRQLGALTATTRLLVPAVLRGVLLAGAALFAGGHGAFTP